MPFFGTQLGPGTFTAEGLRVRPSPFIDRGCIPDRVLKLPRPEVRWGWLAVGSGVGALPDQSPWQILWFKALVQVTSWSWSARVPDRPVVIGARKKYEAQDQQLWHREVRAKSIPDKERQDGGEHRWGKSGWWSDSGTAEPARTEAATSGAGAETDVEADWDYHSRWGWQVAAASAADDAGAWAASAADGADDRAAWNSSLGKSWSSTRSGWEAGRAEGHYEGRDERRRLRAILRKKKMDDGDWEPSRHGGAAAVGQDLCVAENAEMSRGARVNRGSFSWTNGGGRLIF